MSLASPVADAPAVLLIGAFCAHCGREIFCNRLLGAETVWFHLAGGIRECEGEKE